MRRCLLIAAFLLLAAPAAASADGAVTTKLSSTPDRHHHRQALEGHADHQPARARAALDLRPAIQIRDADGFVSTFPAKPTKRAGRYRTTVASRGRASGATRSATASA